MLGFGRRKPRPLALEEQLETLAAHGIRLLPGRTIDELVASWPREQYESEPFSLLLFMLGVEVEEAPEGGFFSDDLYCFDAECIEDRGDYARQIERISQIAKGGLPVEKVSDFVDLEARTIWVEFELDGRRHRYEPEVCDDWFDPKVLIWLASLAVARGGERRLMHLDTGDQRFLIGFATPPQFKGLRRATGQDFRWVV
ncbi:MAG: hypothetical protein IPJ41_17110 [Phycisphaerales bacterium]|nr:hypothetical protein [Phycisphaerales bacterium]